MTTESVTPPPAKKKTRFLQRWAFWIIGGVVVIGFVNARSTKPFLSLALDGDLTASAPVPPKQYIKSDLKFANAALEEFFDRYDEAVRTQEPLVYNQFHTPDRHVISAWQALYPIRMRLITRQNSQRQTEVCQIQATSYVNDVMVKVGLFGARHDNLEVIFSPGPDGYDSLSGKTYYYPHRQVYGSFNYANHVVGFYIPPKKTLPPKTPYSLLFESPERFLEIALDEEDIIKKSAVEAFKTSALFEVGIDHPAFSSYSKPEQDELLQMVMQELEQRRSHLSNNYREMHAQLRDAFPLWETLLKVYGAENKAKEE